MSIPVMFLCWQSLLPAHSGGALRQLGLLQEISRTFEVELIVLSRQPLSSEQETVLNEYAESTTWVPLRDTSFVDKLSVVKLMLTLGLPYHCAALSLSFERYPDDLCRILSFPGVVYASFGHWGTLIRNRQAPNLILDQHNADVHFWRVYAGQVSNPLVKLAALVNWRLSDRHFRRVYRQVGRVVSVCEEDRQHTLALSPQTQVDVIENGVDCLYYVPDRRARVGPPRLLFTGTSAARNMTALHQFVRNVFPLIQRDLPDVELLVAGNFIGRAQARFSAHRNIRFTGQVPDVRLLL
jgi:glycosyltransferase involved in cell wall biosynthesis